MSGIFTTINTRFTSTAMLPSEMGGHNKGDKLNIDQGGCFETSKVTDFKKPTFRKHDVIHYCIPNIASRVSKTASVAISNVLTPLLLRANKFGSFDKLLRSSEGARNGVYIYKGLSTNKHLSNKFRIRFTNLNLVLINGNM